MTCTDIEKSLDEYADGELSDEIRRAVEKHLETCLACNRELREIRSLLDRARRLPADIVPESTLWPGIESRIAETADDGSSSRQVGEPRRSTQLRFLAAAATLLVALSIPLALHLRKLEGPEPSPGRLGQDQLTERHPDTRSTALLARVEDGVVLPRVDLLEALERQRNILSPETVSTIAENALLLDRAIAEARTALAQRPDNRQLQLLLAARYRQEVQLLKLVNHV